MKNFLKCVAALMPVLTAMCACATFSNRGVVVNPMIGTANTSNISFEKVEMTDSSTVLHAVTRFRPGYWIKLAPTCEINVDGVNYPVKSVGGIALGEQVVMPDSGVVRFTMTFPAIPKGARSLHFSEGTSNGWAIWSVDLTGKATHNDNRRYVPPTALKTDRKMPTEMLAYGDSTVINIHILGYKPEMGNRLSWVANTLHGQIGTDLPEAQVDSLGNAVVKLSLSAPARFMPFKLNNSVHVDGTFFVAPGETLNAYLDTHRTGLWNMEQRDGSAYQYPADYEGTYTDGIFPIVARKTYMQFRSGEFGDYRMDGDVYTAYILDVYRTLCDTVDTARDMTEVNRQYNKSMLKGQLIAAAANARQILSRNYYHIHGYEAQIPADSINCVLSPENIRAIAEVIDFNDPMLLLCNDELPGNTKVEFWENAGVDAGLLKAIENYYNAYSAADRDMLSNSDKFGEKGGLSKEQLDALLYEYLKLPAPMAEEVKAHEVAMQEQIKALAAASPVCPTPDVAPTEVFDAIVAPHKGKVVVVDLWNTWCGPCRAAIKATEPEKSGDLANEDIVWIYIANQTSPRAKYLQMIPGIKGLHYQLDYEPWRVICERFSVDGIPFYIIVDRDGNAEGRPDLRDHSLYKKTILEELLGGVR